MSKTGIKDHSAPTQCVWIERKKCVVLKIGFIDFSCRLKMHFTMIPQLFEISL